MADDNQPYPDAAPGSLRERLRDVLSGVVRPAAVAYEAERVEKVVACWLRDQAAPYQHSPDPTERQIRYELLALANAIDTQGGD
jgi:hypothetical protein